MLDKLFWGAIDDSIQRSKSLSRSQLESLVTSMGTTRDAHAALRAGEHIRVIAEIKRASPSKGQLAAIPSAALLGQVYQEHGAAAISVLTESRGFSGSLEDLKQVREQVELPLLRKDFIATEYQILEARHFGADFILLIASWLPKTRLEELFRFAESIGMQVLVETHSTAEIEIALGAGATIVGVNTRDLATFQTDMALFEELSQRIPSGIVRVAESSVKTRRDIERYRDAGAHAVLIGEALVTGDTARLLEDFSSVSA